MGLLSLLVKDPLAFAIIAIPLLYAIVFHELAHGWVANQMGDPTAKSLGRLSLNPLKHIDPMGTIMLFIFGFGWAKPVPVNFSRLRDQRLGMILVSSAGIITNILMAFVALFFVQLFKVPASGIPGLVLYTFAQINIILAAFNLIPIPPLDGSKILMGFLSEEMQAPLLRLEKYGFIIVIALLWMDILDPVIHFLSNLIITVIGLFLS